MRSIDSYRYAYLCRFHSLYAWGRGTTRQLEMISSPTSREAFGFIDSVTLRVFSSSGSLVSQGIPPFSPFCSKTHWWTMIICPEYNLYIYGVKKHDRFDCIPWNLSNTNEFLILGKVQTGRRHISFRELNSFHSRMMWGTFAQIGVILHGKSGEICCTWMVFDRECHGLEKSVECMAGTVLWIEMTLVVTVLALQNRLTSPMIYRWYLMLFIYHNRSQNQSKSLPPVSQVCYLVVGIHAPASADFSSRRPIQAAARQRRPVWSWRPVRSWWPVWSRSWWPVWSWWRLSSLPDAEVEHLLPPKNTSIELKIWWFVDKFPFPTDL